MSTAELLIVQELFCVFRNQCCGELEWVGGKACQAATL